MPGRTFRSGKTSHRERDRKRRANPVGLRAAKAEVVGKPAEPLTQWVCLGAGRFRAARVGDPLCRWEMAFCDDLSPPPAPVCLDDPGRYITIDCMYYMYDATVPFEQAVAFERLRAGGVSATASEANKLLSRKSPIRGHCCSPNCWGRYYVRACTCNGTARWNRAGSRTPCVPAS